MTSSKCARQRSLPLVFTNPLLSKVLQFLPLYEVFKTCRLVCTTWAQAEFSFSFVQIDRWVKRNHEMVMAHLNFASIKAAEINDLEFLVPFFTNATHMYINAANHANFSKCAKLEHLFVNCGQQQAELPASLISLTQVSALEVIDLPKIVSLKTLGGVTNVLNSKHWDMLQTLDLDNCFLSTTDADRINETKFPSGWSFELLTYKDTPLNFLDCPKEIGQCLKTLSINLDVLTAQQFNVLAGFRNLTTLALRGDSEFLLEEIQMGSWPQLEEVVFGNEMSLGIFKSFVSARFLRKVRFIGFSGTDKFDDVPVELSQVTLVKCRDCTLDFVDSLDFPGMDSIDIFTWEDDSVRLRHLSLPKQIKITLTLEMWRVDCLNEFLRRNDFAKEISVTFDTLRGPRSTVVVPPRVLLVLPVELATCLTCVGRVHAVDRKTLPVLNDNVSLDTYMGFKKSIKNI